MVNCAVWARGNISLHVNYLHSSMLLLYTNYICVFLQCILMFLYLICSLTNYLVWYCPILPISFKDTFRHWNKHTIVTMIKLPQSRESTMINARKWFTCTHIAKCMGPTGGPPETCRPQMGPCWPHEPWYQGILQNSEINKKIKRNETFCILFGWIV